MNHRSFCDDCDGNIDGSHRLWNVGGGAGVEKVDVPFFAIRRRRQQVKNNHGKPSIIHPRMISPPCVTSTHYRTPVPGCPNPPTASRLAQNSPRSPESSAVQLLNHVLVYPQRPPLHLLKDFLALCNRRQSSGNDKSQEPADIMHDCLKPDRLTPPAVWDLFAPADDSSNLATYTQPGKTCR
ncbi:hypothetical protein CLAIMM_10625 isoform 1, partial [Cladophialophora immunda]